MYRPAKSISQSVMVMFICFWALSVVSGAFCAAQTTFISQGSIWKYLDNGVDQGTDWRLLSFDDSAWKAGNAKLGYGDGDEATVISYGPNPSDKYRTAYFRKVFSVANASSYSGLTLRILRDDGAVAYLNGTEICRTNMLAGAVLYTTFAQSTIDDNIFYEFTVNPALLVEGDNILAVEVHQANATSSDLGFDLSLAESVVELVKGPYLIYAGNNTMMTVLWQLNAAQNCLLEWGTDTTYSVGSVNTSEYSSDHQHKYAIPNLTPSSHYYYRVTVNGNSSAGNFYTAPPEDVESVSFLAYGDTRTNVSDHESVCARINSVLAADPNYQTMLLHVGDWVNSGDTELSWTSDYFPRTFPNILSMKSLIPVSGCIGNHEGTGVLFQKYWPYPFVGNRYWSFDYGPMHVAILDQYVSYTPGSAQYIWLENDLAASDKHWKFIVLHEPGWSAGGGHGNNTSVQNYIQPLCEKYGVQIIFGGHNHYYARAEFNHVTHLTTGGGGAPLATPDTTYPYLQTTAKSLEFCKIKIQDNYLHMDVVAPNGSIIDTLDILQGDFPPHDGCVNLTDLAALCRHWLETNCGNCGGTSLSYDGKIDIADLNEFCRLWLTCLP